MRFLLDSNVCLRWSDSRASEYDSCMEAVARLAEMQDIAFVCAQVIIESYVVATRPANVNGLGFTIAEAREFLADIQESFPCLPEPSDLADRWQRVVLDNSVMGRQAHDARIAALMQAHGVSNLLTLNARDFARYQGITPITPAEILSQ